MSQKSQQRSHRRLQNRLIPFNPVNHLLQKHQLQLPRPSLILDKNRRRSSQLHRFLRIMLKLNALPCHDLHPHVNLALALELLTVVGKAILPSVPTRKDLCQVPPTCGHSIISQIGHPDRQMRGSRCGLISWMIVGIDFKTSLVVHGTMNTTTAECLISQRMRLGIMVALTGTSQLDRLWMSKCVCLCTEMDVLREIRLGMTGLDACVHLNRPKDVLNRNVYLEKDQAARDPALQRTQTAWI